MVNALVQTGAPDGAIRKPRHRGRISRSVSLFVAGLLLFTNSWQSARAQTDSLVPIPARNYESAPQTTLLVRFENSLTSELPEGIGAAQKKDVVFSRGAQKQGLRIPAGGNISYRGPFFPTEEGLIQFWCRIDRPPRNRQLQAAVIFTAMQGNSTLTLSLETEDRLRIELRNETTQAAAVTPPLRRISEHFSLISIVWRSGSLLSLYVDGSLRASTTCPGVRFGTGPGDEPVTGLLSLSPDRSFTLDELLVSGNTTKILNRVHRDFLRTAPLKGIRIDSAPFGVTSDHVVLVNQRKQIGLRGIRPDGQELDLLSIGGSRESFLESWDGRKILQLTASPPTTATTDVHGGILGKEPGVVSVTARYGELTASSNFQVLPQNLPDLSVRYFELGSRSEASLFDRQTGHNGEVVFFAHVANHGHQPSPGFRYDWRTTLDEDGNGIPNKESPPLSWGARIFPKRLDPGEEALLEIRFLHPGTPYFLELDLDPERKIPELCRSNNLRLEWSEARPVAFGVPRSLSVAYRGLQTLTGSFGIEDLLTGHIDRLNAMLQNTVYSITTPSGVQVRLRIDSLEYVDEETEAVRSHRSFLDVKERGQFTLGPDLLRPEDRVRWQFGLLHELCHAYLAIPDLLCYGVRRRSIYVIGPDQVPANHPTRLATLSKSPIDESEFVYSGSANGPEGSIGNPLPEIADPRRGITVLGPMMSTSFPRLSPANASHVDHYKTFESPELVDTFTRNIPLYNRLFVTDIEGKPLPSAQIRVFQQTPGSEGCFSGYFSRRPKFVGCTDTEGMWTFPRVTDEQWDDPDTDVIEGAIRIPNPFSTVKHALPLTPSITEVNTVFLVEIAIGSRVEYHFIDIDLFHLAFYTGDRNRGTLSIRTNITRKETKDAPHHEQTRVSINTSADKKDLRPIAHIKPAPATIRVGESLTLDGTLSSDPEGRDIAGHRWTVREGHTPIPRGYAPTFVVSPTQPGTITVTLVVNDSVRESDPTIISLEVVP